MELPHNKLPEIIEKILNRSQKNNFSKVKKILIPFQMVTFLGFNLPKFIKKSLNIKKTKLSEIKTTEFKSVAKRQLNSESVK